MANVLRAAVGVSIVWFAIALSGRADAQSCLATEMAKAIISKIGVPTNPYSLLLMALTPNFTGDSSVDEITQLSPLFANRNAEQLRAEDQELDKAQQFVRAMPSTEDTQNSIRNMQKMRDNIAEELKHRATRYIPDALSPYQMRDLENKKVSPVPIDYTRIFYFPHEGPSLAYSPAPIDKLKYGVQVVKWARDKHPVSSFKQASKPGEIDPFEWQMIEAVTQIDSLDRFDGVDAVQTEYWGHHFFDRLIDKSDYDGTLQALNDLTSKPAQVQNEIISGAKEVVRAAVTEQLSLYLDRGVPSQTLRQFADRLNNPDDPVYRSPGYNMCQMSTQVSRAVERGTVQRNKAVKFKNEVSSQAAYRELVEAFRHGVEEDNKKRANFNNLMQGHEDLNQGAALATTIPKTGPELYFQQFLYPPWK